LRVEVLDTEAALLRTETTEMPSGLQLVDLLAPRWAWSPRRAARSSGSSSIESSRA
jgi:hypothetical protein